MTLKMLPIFDNLDDAFEFSVLTYSGLINENGCVPSYNLEAIRNVYQLLKDRIEQ